MKHCLHPLEENCCHETTRTSSHSGARTSQLLLGVCLLSLESATLQNAVRQVLLPHRPRDASPLGNLLLCLFSHVFFFLPFSPFVVNSCVTLIFDLKEAHRDLPCPRIIPPLLRRRKSFCSPFFPFFPFFPKFSKEWQKGPTRKITPVRCN